MRHFQNVTGGGSVRLPHVGVGIAAQDDLLAVIVQPLAQAGHVHGLAPVHQSVAVPHPGKGGIIELSLAGIEGGLAGQDIHPQVGCQLPLLQAPAGKLRTMSHLPRMIRQGPGIQIHAPQHIPGRLGQSVVPVRLQRCRAQRRDIGGRQLIHRHLIQHPAKTSDMVPVEVGDEQQVQPLHPLLAKEISGIDPAGVLVLQRRMVIPYQIVMAAVHQHGKARPSRRYLPHQNGIAVAHVDKVQCKHVHPPLFAWFYDITTSVRGQRKAGRHGADFSC